MNILLINDTESAEDFAFMLGILGLKKHRVRAIFPSLEYAKMVCKKNSDKFDFIVIENCEETLLFRINLINELATDFRDIYVISIGERKYERRDMPNIQWFEKIEEAARFIAEHSDLKEEQLR